MISADELCTVREPQSLWPQVFQLTDAANVETDVLSQGGALVSDGTGVWWAAAQVAKRQAETGSGGVGATTEDGSDSIDALLAGLQSMPPANIADDALGEWLKYFAGHKVGSEER